MSASGFRSPAEESLGKCGDEADFDEEAHDRFQGGDGRDGIAELKLAGEEASPVKGGDAEDQRLSQSEVSKYKVADGEARDHEQVDREATPRLVAIAR